MEFMEQIKTARALIADIVTALQVVEATNHNADVYVRRLINELMSDTLERTALASCRAAPLPEWQQLLKGENCDVTRKLLRTLQKLETVFSWIGGSYFWPEPEHKKFSEKLWGALIIGPENATFNAKDRYFALLAIIGAQTTYPLHQHRIEELYYVISGHAEWSHNGKDWITLPPGSIFHNNPHQPHAIRTNTEPLLFVSFYLPPFGWEGGMVEDVGAYE